MDAKFSVRKLAKECSLDRATATKLVAGCKTEAEARAAIEDWIAAQPAHGESDVDPETGLSWYRAKLREDTLRLRAQREAERMASGGEWIPVSEVADAAKMVGFAFQNFGTSIYEELSMLPNRAVLDAPENRQHLRRVCERHKSDFEHAIASWLQRHAEISAEKRTRRERAGLAADPTGE